LAVPSVFYLEAACWAVLLVLVRRYSGCHDRYPQRADGAPPCERSRASGRPEYFLLFTPTSLWVFHVERELLILEGSGEKGGAVLVGIAAQP
jgi:hypothetical protein